MSLDKYRQSHANQETYCGLNGSSLDRRKGEKEGRESLEGSEKATEDGEWWL